MDERATGLILRTRPLTDTSLIVHWLTPEFGRLATVAKGARRAKSPFRGMLDLFHLAEFSFARSRRSELHQLREVRLIKAHEAFRHDLPLLQQAAYCAALIERTTETETPLPQVYELMIGFLEALSGSPARARNVFAFELKLLDELGLAPDLAKSHLMNGTRSIVKILGEGDWPVVSNLKLSPAQTAELRRFLNGFLILHLGKIPESRSAAVNV